MNSSNPGSADKTNQSRQARPGSAAAGARWRLLLLVLVGIAGSGYLIFSRIGKPRLPNAEASPVTARPGIPVEAATARAGDLNRYVTALGTVTPFYTVTVKSRVDGEIVSVAFREGQIVHKGDLLIQIDPRPFEVQLEQAQGQLARDKANLTNARITLARDKTLLTEKVIAPQDYDNQAAVVGQYQGTILSDQAAIDNARLQLTYSRITAPISGRIGLRLVDPGNIVHATDTQGLAVITQIRPIAVLFSIPEDDLPRVRKDVHSGDTLAVEAYDRTLRTRLAAGALLTYDNQIDPTTGTVRLKASFPNEDFSLFPNQFVNVRMLVDRDRNVVMIPTAAVQRSALGTFIYVVKPDNTAQVRKVLIGATEGDITSIKSGIQPGERIVIEGADRLQQGSKVKVRMAANTGETASPGLVNQDSQSVTP